ncbi:hypothetical protein BH09CHL1_BH09CHL1_30420 [soil metagenome]
MSWVAPLIPLVAHLSSEQHVVGWGSAIGPLQGRTSAQCDEKLSGVPGGKGARRLADALPKQRQNLRAIDAPWSEN